MDFCFKLTSNVLIMFRLHDVTGYGLALTFAKEMAEAFPDRTFQSPLHELMLQHGRQGK